MLLLEIHRICSTSWNKSQSRKSRSGARLDGSRRGPDRKVEAAVRQKNIVEFEGRPGEAYNPALHKRLGSERVEGMGPLLVARTVRRDTPASSLILCCNARKSSSRSSQ